MVQGAAIVQVVDQRVTGPDAEGTCALEGTAARVLRGAVPEIAPFRASFACEYRDAEAGGSIVHDRREVARAGAVELHLDTEGRVAG
jgi:hypothetical protein